MHYILINGTELLALCCWLVFARRRNGPALILGFQVVLANLVETAALFTLPEGFTKVDLYNIYLLAEFALLGLMLALIELRLKRIITFANLFLLAVWLIETVSFKNMERINIFYLLLSSFVLCALSSWLLWRMSLHEREPLYRSPLFWLLLGMVVYFGGISPVFTSYNYLASHKDIMSEYLYWIVRILCAVRYLSVSYTFFRLRDGGAQLRIA